MKITDGIYKEQNISPATVLVFTAIYIVRTGLHHAHEIHTHHYVRQGKAGMKSCSQEKLKYKKRDVRRKKRKVFKLWAVNWHCNLLTLSKHISLVYIYTKVICTCKFIKSIYLQSWHVTAILSRLHVINSYSLVFTNICIMSHCFPINFLFPHQQYS